MSRERWEYRVVCADGVEYEGLNPWMTLAEAEASAQRINEAGRCGCEMSGHFVIRRQVTEWQRVEDRPSRGDASSDTEEPVS